MNIVTPTPTNVSFVTANVNTEAAKKENLNREVIQQLKGNEASAKESGLGSDSDKIRHQGQAPHPVSYDLDKAEGKSGAQQHPGEKDNAKDESAGKQEQQEQQRKNEAEALKEQEEISDLRARDREVRAHEQAHAAMGGMHAGSPNFEYQRGPDGKRYAVGGSVEIDISPVPGDPQATIMKMQQVQAAALAPAQPSSQDRAVANEAAKIAAAARLEMAQEQNAELVSTAKKALGEEDDSAPEVATNASDGHYISSKTLEAEEETRAAQRQPQSKEDLAYIRAPEINARAVRIAYHYNDTAMPKTDGFSAVA